MALFDFVENFFFISLGITFALILLLVYHFKQRISSMERKGDTMFELLSNVVKEMQCMKGLNSYYTSLFSSSRTIDEPVCAFSNPIIQKSEPEKKVIDLTISNDAFAVTPNVQVVKQTTDKMVVSDDDDDGDSAYSETTDSSDPETAGSDDEEDDEDTTISFDEPLPPLLQSGEEVSDYLDDFETLDDLTNTIYDVTREEPDITEYVPEMLNDVSVSTAEDQPDTPFDESLLDITVSPLPDVVHITTPHAVESGPTREQKRDVYFKMNINQLKSLAITAGIQQDISKMKKKELISLLESLDE
jgi:hypothetical protein